MGVSPGTATEELAAGVLLLGVSGCPAAGGTDGGSGDGCVRWVAGTSRHPELSLVVQFPGEHGCWWHLASLSCRC